MCEGIEETSSDDNLANLPDITSHSITDTLTSRYLSNKIYTRIGDILIALNPFESTEIYSEEFINRYATQPNTYSLPPHLFSISQTAFTNLRTKGHNQCCVISGESGSGKTETAKLLMRFLSQSCITLVPDLPNQCHQMNPLIEAFGNAKTVMNGNSSRFGKYVELQFTPTGELVGAKITEYLLEKSRVISHAEGEQNFHIFYYIYAGLTPEYQNKLKLEISSTHRYLASNPVDAVVLSDVDNQRAWREKFQEMVVCFQTLGFSRELLFQILSVLITILYIGDIEFSSDEDEYACVSNSGMVIKVAGILGIPSRKLEYVLTSIVTTIQGGEVVFRRCSLEKASALRDATAKAIYSRLFSWIIAQINASLGKSHWSGKIISVLDIFGFENFKVNYFEQLCIDTANEQLQFYFNQHIFAWEVEEYRLEGIPLENIEFVNNKQICDLLLKRPGGILSLLDEESVFPRASDQTFVDKIKSQCSKNNEEIIAFPRAKNLTFSINHFAGKVEYSCQDILEKNRDTLSDNIVQLLENCEHYLIRELFNKNSLNRIGNVQIKSKYLNCPKRSNSRKKTWGRASNLTHSSRRSVLKKRDTAKSPSSGGAPPTVGLMFRNSLCDLMEKMLSCDPHFIRCIKPNQRHFPGQVERDFIERQLRSTGVLETVRIRQNGYSYRPDFATFLRLYGTLVFPHSSHPQPSGANCALVLDRLGVENWEIGESRVFLKYYHASRLDLMRERELERIVTTQGVARGFLARRVVERMRTSARFDEEATAGLCREIDQGCALMLSRLTELKTMDEDKFASLALSSESKVSDSEDVETTNEPTTPLYSPILEFPPPPELSPNNTDPSTRAESDGLEGDNNDEQQESTVESLPEVGAEGRFSQYFEPENLPTKLRSSISIEFPFTHVINKKRLSRHSLSGGSRGDSSYQLSTEGDTEDTQTPKMDTGDTQTPKMDTGDTRIPKMDTGDTQTPKVETGDTRTPKMDTGDTQTPKMGTGDTQTPKMGTGDTQTPKMDTGDTQTPKMDTGDTQTPKMDTGDTQTPKVDTGDTQTPKVDTGDTQTPKMDTGDTQLHKLERESKNVKVESVPRPAPKPHCYLAQTGEKRNWLLMVCYVKDINLGKFLISQPSIVVDGSKNIFDSSCISLGALMKSSSHKKSLKRASHIDKGIEIFRDQVGDVLCKRMSKKPIRIVNFESKPFYSSKLTALKGCLPLNELVKILDYAKFREYIANLSNAITHIQIENMLEVTIQFEVHKDVTKIPRIEITFLEPIEHFKQTGSQPNLTKSDSRRLTESVGEDDVSYNEESMEINESVWVNIYRTHNKKHQKSQRRKRVVASSAFMSENGESEVVRCQAGKEAWSQSVEVSGQPLEVEFTGPVVRRARSSKRTALNTKSEDVDQLIRTSYDNVKSRDRAKSTELETLQVATDKIPVIASLPETRNITPQQDEVSRSELPEISIQTVPTSQSLQQIPDRPRPNNLPGVGASGKVTMTSIRRRNRGVEKKRVNELLASPTAHASPSKDEDRPVYLATQPNLQPQYSQFHGRGAIPVVNLPENIIQMHKVFLQQADELSKMKGRLFSNEVSAPVSEPRIEGLIRKRWHRPMTKKLVESRPFLARVTSQDVRKK